jgi:hypothetical protein
LRDSLIAINLIADILADVRPNKQNSPVGLVMAGVCALLGWRLSPKELNPVMNNMEI